MSEQAFFVLTALVDEPRHGYGIVREVADLSGWRVRLRVGTLYGVLDRLVGEGLAEHDREEIASGRLRRYYRLTDAGRRRLADEVERQAANARVAGDRLRLRRGGHGMTPLERRYRRVMRLLPADYREVWEEGMVDTFLLSRVPDQPDCFDADFDAEYGRPSWSEVASVVGLAVRLRLGGVHAPPRSFARGEVVRRVALAGLLVHAVAVVVGVVSLLVTQARFPVYRVPTWTPWRCCPVCCGSGPV